MAKVSSKYLFEIAQELRIDLVRRSPAASVSYIILGLGLAFTGLGTTEYRNFITLFGSIAFMVSVWRIYLSRKIIKNLALATNRNLKLHNMMILVNATCFALCFGLITLGNSQQSLPFLISAVMMMAILVGGISSLSPAPRTQLYFFITCSLCPWLAMLVRTYLDPVSHFDFVFPLLFPVGFIYSFIQGKQFRKHLIERYEYEFMIKDERDLLQSVLDAVPGFIIYLDRSLKIISITAGLEKKFNNTMTTGDSLDTDKFEFTKMVRQFRDSAAHFISKEICLSTKISEEWFLISLKKIDNGQSMVIVGASIDELRKVREDLAEQTNRAMNASKLAALGELAAGAGHEINNPVAIVHGYMTEMKVLLQKEEFTLKEKFLEKIDKSSKSLIRIKKIVSGMRLLSRDAENDPLEEAQFKSILEDTLSLCQERFIQNGVKFDIAPIPETMLNCRATQVSQVLLNVLNNAFDAIENQAEKKINMSFYPEKSSLKIVVSDNGPGVPEENKERIYDPFFTTKDPGKGTGLGLSISKRIMSEHKGHISYKYNNGAQFTLEFPMAATMLKGA